MRIALIADVHGNREAFDAVLAAILRDRVDRIALLGDLVGYGGDPAYVVARAAELVAHGAVAIQGDHDAAAVTGEGAGLNDYARAAIEWTHSVLGKDARAFLAGLPLTHEEADRLYVHADASAPRNWIAVENAPAADLSLAAASARVTICGHVHKPAIYNQARGGSAIAFTPATDAPVPLLAQRRWLATLGACGQPRDDNPAASYAILDETTRAICYRRAPYDIETAARKIHAAGLPQILAARLFVGR